MILGTFNRPLDSDARSCPVCGADIWRYTSTFVADMLAAFLPASEGDLQRYKARDTWRCTSEDCGASGSIYKRGYGPISERDPGDETGVAA